MPNGFGHKKLWNAVQNSVKHAKNTLKVMEHNLFAKIIIL